jgi:proteic killer suppression protein
MPVTPLAMMSGSVTARPPGHPVPEGRVDVHVPEARNQELAGAVDHLASRAEPTRPPTKTLVVPFPVNRYTRCVIRSFRSKATADLFHDREAPRFRAFERVARRKLLLLHGAKSIQDLTVPPGNRLEELKGRRQGQHSIRINDQWRLCFVWRDSDAFDVEIVDYHGEKK